jgi:hypothetical protein
LISLVKSEVFFLFFSENQARFANGLQNLFVLRSSLDEFCERFEADRRSKRCCQLDEGGSQLNV